MSSSQNRALQKQVRDLSGEVEELKGLFVAIAENMVELGQAHNTLQGYLIMHGIIKTTPTDGSCQTS